MKQQGHPWKKKIKKKSHNNHGIIVSTPNLACICQKDACTISINLAATLNNIKKKYHSNNWDLFSLRGNGKIILEIPCHFAKYFRQVGYRQNSIHEHCEKDCNFWRASADLLFTYQIFSFTGIRSTVSTVGFCSRFLGWGTFRISTIGHLYIKHKGKVCNNASRDKSSIKISVRLTNG